VKSRPKFPKVDDAEEVEVDQGWELVDASDAGDEFKVDGGEQLEEQRVFKNENDAWFDAMFDKLLGYMQEMGTFRMPG